MKNKAIILLSGGLDSLTCLAIAHNENKECHALSFNYNQRNKYELNKAKNIAKYYQAKHHIVNLQDLNQFTTSSLTNHNLTIPNHQNTTEIPSTYVPARNTIFLSIALGLAETLGASEIYTGINAIDYSHYPDCRPEFLNAFQNLTNTATKMTTTGSPITIKAPLISLTKKEIIELGTSLNVDYSMSLTCYNPNENGHACGKCDSCAHRKNGFKQANAPDPTIYAI